jgi:hypothetical protein
MKMPGLNIDRIHTLRRTRPLKALIPTEHQDQVALFAWLRARYGDSPLYWATPNAAKRSPRLAAHMKAEGMRAGTPDLAIMVPRGTYHGCFLELKRRGSTKSAVLTSQSKALAALSDIGYYATWAAGFDEAQRVIAAYLQDWHA